MNEYGPQVPFEGNRHYYCYRERVHVARDFLRSLWVDDVTKTNLHSADWIYTGTTCLVSDYPVLRNTFTKQSQPSSCFKNTLLPSVSKVYFAFKTIYATRVIEQVKVRCSKFECREDIHFKTQRGPVGKMQLQGLRLGIEPVSSVSLESSPTLYQLSYRSRY